jgi:hypothetical protein
MGAKQLTGGNTDEPGLKSSILARKRIGTKREYDAVAR